MEDAFSSQTKSSTIVRGIAERIPLRAAVADAVTTFWRLSDVGSLARAVANIDRGLKPGGVLVAVLEHMEPTSRDLVASRFDVRPGRRETAIAKLSGCLPGRPWSVQVERAGKSVGV